MSAKVEDLSRPHARSGGFFTPEGETLCVAAEASQSKALGFLIERGVNANAIGREGENALYVAAKSGQLKSVETLLASGANVNARIARNGYTALFGALIAFRPGVATETSSKIAEILLSHGANVNATAFNGDRLLHLAVTKEYGNREVVRLLLTRGASVDARDRSNKTALMLASVRREPIIADYLLSFGADVQATDTAGHDALCLAAVGLDIRREHSTANAALLVDILSAHGADINGERQAVPPIILAFGHRSLNAEPSGDLAYTIIKALLDAGADVERPDTAGFTPLHRWLEIKQFSTFQILALLLERGANADKASPLGKTPLTYACSAGREYDAYHRMKVVKLLIVYGANVHAPDENGDTPVMALLFNSEIDKEDKLELTDTLTGANVEVNVVGHPEVPRMYGGSIRRNFIVASNKGFESSDEDPSGEHEST